MTVVEELDVTGDSQCDRCQAKVPHWCQDETMLFDDSQGRAYRMGYYEALRLHFHQKHEDDWLRKVVGWWVGCGNSLDSPVMPSWWNSAEVPRSSEYWAGYYAAQPIQEERS